MTPTHAVADAHEARLRRAWMQAWAVARVGLVENPRVREAIQFRSTLLVMAALPWQDTVAQLLTAIVAAGAFGLPLLEVHLRLPHVDTLDAPFAYYPDEFAELVRLIRDTEALGAEPGAEDACRPLRRPSGGLRGAA